jgi:hypothetical protein
MAGRAHTRDITIGPQTYKLLFNTAALCQLEEITDEAFWTFQNRIVSGSGIRSRDVVAMLAAGLEGARVAMFRTSPQWTLERTAALFDDDAAPTLSDWTIENGRELGRAMGESLVSKPKAAPAAGEPAAAPLDPSPLADRASGTDT